MLEPSRYETWRLEIVAPSEDDVDALGRRLAKHLIVLEDWTGSVRMLCHKCSTGVPHEHHGDEMIPAWRPTREIAFALREVDPKPVLDAWTSDATGRSASKMERVL